MVKKKKERGRKNKKERKKKRRYVNEPLLYVIELRSSLIAHQHVGK
jgi:hypothetical protein